MKNNNGGTFFNIKALVIFSFFILVLGGIFFACKTDAAVGVACLSGTAPGCGRAMVFTTSNATTPILSQTSTTVGIGQLATITSTNGMSVYMTANSSPTVVAVTANGTQITVTGQALGSASIIICTVGTSSDCTNLSVTVQAGNAAGVLFSSSSLSLSTNSSQSVTISGGNDTYMVWSNSNTSVASTNLSGSILTVTGLVAGSTTITVCDTSSTNTCGTFFVTVNSSNSSSASGISLTYPQTTSLSYTFSKNLTVGSTGSDVIALQQILINKGFLTSVSAPTGYFGSGTRTALVKLQVANDISPASGYCGSITRTFLDSMSMSLTQSTSTADNQENQNSIQTNSTLPLTPSNTNACNGTSCNGACYSTCASGQDFVCPASGKAYCQISQQQTTNQIDALTIQCNNQMDSLNQQIQDIKTKYNGLIDAYAGQAIPNKEIQIQIYENAENGQVQQLQGQEQQLYDTCTLQLNALQ